ncbi:MAG TPA: PilZ domain-containing protein [Chloroflexota bacterium]|nr:PilZ domain-containing protein [Chloroflexota bacterium]
MINAASAGFSGAERRRFYRAKVVIPATLFLEANEDMRRTCEIFDLSGSGCALRYRSMEPVPDIPTHHLRFELPNRSLPVDFDCELVGAKETPNEIAQDLRFHFVNPRPGDQDAIISYLQNRKRFERTSFRVAIPVSIEAQGGLHQFVAYRGETSEVGRDYAICEMPKFPLAVSQDVVATFRGPKFRDEIFFQGVVLKVDHTARGGYRTRVELERTGDGMVDFVRKLYRAKAKPIASPNER